MSHPLADALIEHFGRLFVSVQHTARGKVICPSGKKAKQADIRAGVDLGLRFFATVAGSGGELWTVENPARFAKPLLERRRTTESPLGASPDPGASSKRKPNLPKRYLAAAGALWLTGPATPHATSEIATPPLA
jgi:hypothetical protein